MSCDRVEDVGIVPGEAGIIVCPTFKNSTMIAVIGGILGSDVSLFIQDTVTVVSVTLVAIRLLAGSGGTVQ